MLLVENKSHQATKEFGKIIEYQKTIRKKYRDAFVIALENGKKISVKQALEEIKN